MDPRVVAIASILSGTFACAPAPCEEARALEPTLARALPAVVTAAPVAFDPIGVDACDDYVARFRRCIDERAPPDTRAHLLDSLASSAKSWRELARGPGRDFLDATCRIAEAGSRASTADFGCDWDDELIL